MIISVMVKNNMNIACIIVTYNRKQFLKRCLDAVNAQTFRPQKVFIVDNASTDGTMCSVKEWGYHNCVNNGIVYEYILNGKNEGGAGGFHLGLKTAFEDSEYDGFWVMDDDGEPDKECLKELVRFLGDRDYIAPIVLSDEDRKTCSFIPGKTYTDICKTASSDGIFENWASPFNGILYSHKLVKTIGYPKKEMFIWGDEINYHIRAKNAGFCPLTNVRAIHYHPVDRQVGICNEDTLNRVISVVNADWKLYCLLRNRTYNLHFMYNFYVAFKKARELYQTYIHYFHSIGDFTHDRIVFDAVVSGYFGYFGGLKKYLEK